MRELIISIIAAISVLSLGIYEFLCVCRIIKQEKLVEQIWEYILPDKPYDERMLFMGIRPMLLTISFLTFALSGGVIAEILVYRVMLIAATPLSLGVLIRNSKEN